MADLDAIRRGVAALLRQSLPEDEGTVSPYFKVSPGKPCLQVAGVQSMGRSDFGDGRSWTVAIEGVFSLALDEAAQRLLDRVLTGDAGDGIVAVDEAIESDADGAGALYDRLLDDGTIDEDVGAACQDIAFVAYLGSARVTLEDGTKALLATWTAQIET